MADDHQHRDELTAQFAAEIKANKNFENYFRGFSPSSVNSFVELYALQKAMWTIYGPTFKDILEKLETQWVNEAMERLAEIQQVKLFLFQCRYRAGAVEEPYERVRTIFDFIYWRHNILNATFLEPVCEQDIELYTEYMLSNDGHSNPFDFLEDWQDFDAIREAYNTPEDEEAGRNVPEWYEYYFNHTGTGIELTLPDLKKEKDTYYFLKGNDERTRLLIEEEQKAIAENLAPPPEEGVLFNGYEEDVRESFMKVFEDKENRGMHEEYKKWQDYTEREDMLQEDLEMLFYANENIEIEANENWAYAVQLAAARYRTKKIAESLPAAFEQYKLNLMLGIRYPEQEDSVTQSAFYNDLVLLGRKLSGEPEDFDY